MRLGAAVLAAAFFLPAFGADRSRVLRAEFQRLEPCPSTGKIRGPCPGYQVDHIQPLCAGGIDKLDNLQWLAVDPHKEKTRRDVAACFGRVYRPPKPASPPN